MHQVRQLPHLAVGLLRKLARQVASRLLQVQARALVLQAPGTLGLLAVQAALPPLHPLVHPQPQPRAQHARQLLGMQVGWPLNLVRPAAPLLLPPLARWVLRLAAVWVQQLRSCLPC